jgi:hypothetical protein
MRRRRARIGLLIARGVSRNGSVGPFPRGTSVFAAIGRPDAIVEHRLGLASSLMSGNWVRIRLGIARRICRMVARRFASRTSWRWFLCALLCRWARVGPFCPTCAMRRRGAGIVFLIASRVNILASDGAIRPRRTTRPSVRVQTLVTALGLGPSVWTGPRWPRIRLGVAR